MRFTEEIEPQLLEREVDEAYRSEIRFELEQMRRQRLIEWGKEWRTETGKNALFFAVYSAVSAAWDDVRNDIRRGTITVDEANAIVDKFVDFDLMNTSLAATHKERFSGCANVV